MFRLSAFERLPNELKTMVFAETADTRSLLSAVMSSRNMYNSFRPDERRIAGEVTSRELEQLDVVDDALAAVEARSLLPHQWTIQGVKAVPEAMKEPSSKFMHRCNLAKTLQIAALNRKVLQLAEKLANRYLLLAADEFDDGSIREAANPSDVARIMRALYRYEMYSAFFGGNPDLRHITPGEDQRAAFWRYFAPWEMEQMACVMEGLESELYEMTEALALDDPVWTRYVALNDVLVSSREGIFQGILSQGLEYVYELIFGYTQEDKSKLKPPGGECHFDIDFLAKGLELAVPNTNGIALCTLDERPELQKQFFDEPVIDDEDTGPEDVWRWAYHYEEDLVLCTKMTNLRACGYVFWDRTRLSFDWGLMEWRYEGVWSTDVWEWEQQRAEAFQARLNQKIKEMKMLGQIEQSFRYVGMDR